MIGRYNTDPDEHSAVLVQCWYSSVSQSFVKQENGKLKTYAVERRGRDWIFRDHLPGHDEHRNVLRRQLPRSSVCSCMQASETMHASLTIACRLPHWGPHFNHQPFDA